MAEIDAWEDVLPTEMREVWPVLGQATEQLEGCLMGGTALAVHLRHRISFDLDYMTVGPFSGDHLAEDTRRRRWGPSRYSKSEPTS